MNMIRKILAGALKLLLISVILLLNQGLLSGQKGLTLEEALKVAEDNSPSMKRTKLSLIRSQENLNAQKAALKSNFSLSINPIGYNQTREFNDLISQFIFEFCQSF